jgi:transglutaminase-like putative cysteine protease
LKATSGNLPIRDIPLEETDRAGVFAVCLCFLFSLAPHFFNLPVWISAVVVLAIGWRALQNLGLLKPMPKWLLIPLVLAGGIGVFAEYWTIVGRDAGLALLTVMAAFKFLESRNHRDMLILVFLCYFLIATHFLYSQSIPTALLMFATLIIITTTLITLNLRDNGVPVLERLRDGARLVGMSIPLMLVLFVLVPRVPGPLWGLQSEQRGGVTGLSDRMSPGEISNLIRSNEVAFRVDFEGPIPPQSQLYWRGPVMAKYNGYTWFQLPRGRARNLDIYTDDPGVEYTVTLEPNGEQWLLALDIPTRLVKGSLMSKDYQLISRKDINDIFRYSMRSRLDYRIGIDESPQYLARALQYPENSNPRTIELGKSLAERHDSSEAIIDAVLRMYREQPFTYTLQPPALGEDSVDAFLFDTRRGFCEHYAGSFALLMRAAGIPARIVAGYQGGEYNRVGNYLIVRQSDAHAWTEVWIENRGWVRVDPTAAVSPSRIEQGLDDALGAEASGFRIQNRNPIFGNLLYSWDNLQHSWNDWVLNYDQRKQRDFLNQLEIGIETWSDMVFALVILLISVTALFWLVVWYRERPARPAVYELLFRRMLSKLSKRGYAREPWEDTRDFVARLSQCGLPEYDQVAQIVDLYNQIKYGRRGASTQAVKRLRTAVYSLRL